MKKSTLEKHFELLLRSELGEGIPKPVSEYRFHPTRKWRWDYCWENKSVAVELQGGVYSGGRHVRGKGYTDDLEKHNAGVLLGWSVLYFTAEQVTSNGQKCLEDLKFLLDKAPEI